MKNDLMEKIVNLCKNKGFINLSSEPYGGFSSCYDYGPLGVVLKNNIKKAWWEEMTCHQENIVGLDAAILMSPKVWEASGHLTAGFADELMECKKCHKRFRVESKITSKKLPEEIIEHIKTEHPEIEMEPIEFKSVITERRKFNLMMKTFVGPVENEASLTYLRAETCQGIYMNFNWVKNAMRLKIPFGIAQIGKAFRNEITPGNFIYRTREFEQMEMQFFVNPKEADKWFDYWKETRMKWYLNLGIKKENLRFHEHEKKELAHYARKAIDIEYKFPFGWNEIEGIHNRGDWDLSNHSKASGQDLSYFEEEKKEKYIPYIIETSAGADRSLLAFLIDAYFEVKGGRTETTESVKEIEIVLKLDKKLSPVKVAVFPLVKNKKDLTKKSEEVYNLLRNKFLVQYDEIGSIGRRYRRQDEIGTPYCLTIDFQTLKDNTVTVRDRDTMKQERVKIDKLNDTLVF